MADPRFLIMPHESERYLPGYYFWGEMWADAHGPFATFEEREAAFKAYCEEYLGPAT